MMSPMVPTLSGPASVQPHSQTMGPATPMTPMTPQSADPGIIPQLQ